MTDDSSSADGTADDSSSADGTVDDGADDTTDDGSSSDGTADDGDEEESDAQSGSSHELEYVEYVAATCVDDGNIEYWYCAICDGYFLDEDATEEVAVDEIVIQADDSSHTGEWIVYIQPSCTNWGERILSCTSCGNICFEDIAPTGEHVYGEWEVVTAATCESAGEKERKCENCDEVQTEEIEQLEHEYEVTVQAYCTKPGQIVYVCSYCGDEYIEYIEAIGHNFIVCEAQAATCTENGWEEYEICTRCKETQSYTEIPATGHDYVDTVDGDYTIHTCQNCRASYSESNIYTLTYRLASGGAGYIVTGLKDGSDCTDLVIPDYYNGYPVTEIAEWAFSDNTDIISLTIGENVTTIGQYAFSGCTNLTTIYYNAVAVESSAINVFRNAGRNTSGITLYVGAAVISIPANLFTATKYSTTSANITEIVFAENGSLETIGAYAFAGCDGLKSVSIPSTCTKIGNYAFINCTSLSYIEVSANATIYSTAFSNIAKNYELITY